MGGFERGDAPGRRGAVTATLLKGPPVSPTGGIAGLRFVGGQPDETDAGRWTGGTVVAGSGTPDSYPGTRRLTPPAPDFRQ